MQVVKVLKCIVKTAYTYLW